MFIRTQFASLRQRHAGYVRRHSREVCIAPLIVVSRLNARHSIRQSAASESGVNSIPLALRATGDKPLMRGAPGVQRPMVVDIHKETTVDLVSVRRGLLMILFEADANFISRQGGTTVGETSETGDVSTKGGYSLA